MEAQKPFGNDRFDDSGRAAKEGVLHMQGNAA